MGEDRKYFGDWSNWDEMKRDWGNESVATDAEVLMAEYTYEDYSGSAFVLFERDGKLYENHGGHCSCYGLEGQWSPEETTWAALAMRPWNGITPEGTALVRSLIEKHALKPAE